MQVLPNNCCCNVYTAPRAYTLQMMGPSGCHNSVCSQSVGSDPADIVLMPFTAADHCAV